MNYVTFTFLAISFSTLALSMEKPKEKSVQDLLNSKPNYQLIGLSSCNLRGEGLTSVEGIGNVDRIKDLYRINLDDNNIRLEGTPFKHLALTYCHIITLNRNNLTSVNPAFFEGLPNLEHLELMVNDLRELPADWGPLTKLQTLSLERNPHLTRELVSAAQEALPNTTIYV